MKINKFEISFRDRDDFDYLLVEIRYLDTVICEINKEKGLENLEVEMLCNDVLYNDIVIKYPFADFLNSLNIAREMLIKN